VAIIFVEAHHVENLFRLGAARFFGKTEELAIEVEDFVGVEMVVEIGPSGKNRCAA
jgi:hypothetical protein